MKSMCYQLRKAFRKVEKVVVGSDHAKSHHMDRQDAIAGMLSHKGPIVAHSTFSKSTGAASLLTAIQQKEGYKTAQAEVGVKEGVAIGKTNDSLEEEATPAVDSVDRSAEISRNTSSSERALRQKRRPTRLNLSVIADQTRIEFRRQNDNGGLLSTPTTAGSKSSPSSPGCSQVSGSTSATSLSQPSPSLKPPFLDRIADAHFEASKRAWQTYMLVLQSEDTEATEADSRFYLQQLHDIQETDKAGLKTEIFTAECIIKAREVDLEDDRDDHVAEVEELNRQRDEALQKLEEREEELEYATERRAEIEEEANVAKKERDVLRNETATWRLRTTEAMTIGDDLRSQLDAAITAKNLLGSNNESATTILHMNSHITHLQATNEKREDDIRILYEALENARQQHLREEAEIKRLQAENKTAALEVGLLAQININYRHMTEDHPELSAHLDGLLKRKDEAYSELVRRFDEFASKSIEHKLMRDTDREHFDGVRTGLRRQIFHLEQERDGLEMSRDNFQKQLEEVYQMFTEKITKDDVVEALTKDKEIYRKDNEFLIKQVLSREAHVEEYMAEIAPLKVKIVELEHALDISMAKQCELQADANGLDIRNKNLRQEVEDQNSELHFKNRELQASLSSLTQQLERLHRNSFVTPIAQQLAAMKDNEIAGLKTQLQKAVKDRSYWYNRVTEQRPDFCHVHDGNLVEDLNSEETRQRLRYAEKMAAELRDVVKEAGILQNMHAGMDPRHAQVEEAEEQIRRFAEEDVV